MNYLWDSQFHLYRSRQEGDFNYSDGVEVEQRLLHAVASARDRSTFSQELQNQVQDWPSEYHLSRRRHCLLRPLNIQAGDRVLELGCGCGALTRYLGEIGAKVVAVEGSLARARIAAERSRDLPNVRVFVDDLLHFETDEQFDYVMLIGVLEYAARFAPTDSPHASYLEVVSRALAPRGKLVVAIENQLGLKYLNGCTEDHVGMQFFGIQDLYGAGMVRTFGRKELANLLSAAGFPNIFFYYPFPDYKLPSVILSEQAFADSDFNAADVVAHCQARDYNGASYRCFDEALAASVLYKNGLLADLSNSFLVVATSRDGAEIGSAELAFSWSVDRVAEFCIQTTFKRRDTDIEVRKSLLTSPRGRQVCLPGGIAIRHEPQESVYCRGRQLLSDLRKARARSGDVDAMVEALLPWMSFLLRHAYSDEPTPAQTPVATSELASFKIAGKFLDCLPANLLRQEEELTPIDVEWDSDHDIPLGWVITRGLVWSLRSGVPLSSQTDSLHAIAQVLCRASGLRVEERDMQLWLELEAAFQTAVTGRRWKAEDIGQLSGGLRSFNELLNELHYLQTLSRNLHQQIDDLQQVVVLREEEVVTLAESVTLREKEISRVLRELDRLQIKLSAATEGWTAKLASLLKPAAALKPSRWHARRQLERDMQLVNQSGLFDAAWYVSQNTDVAVNGADPLAHYLQCGGMEGRDPSPGFSSAWYLEQNADVRELGTNPLVHYLRFGREEGRRPSPQDPALAPQTLARGHS